nr:hypothetical protein [Bacillus ectoiniformans]
MILVLVSTLLSGCLYPQQDRAQNQVPYEDQLQAVQSAVEQYKEQNDGLLPIKTKEGNPPIYEKYPIDFKKLAPQFMAEPPGNSFEMGGIFQYVIIDAETEPKVKLFDLRMAEQIRELKIRLQAQKGYPPFKEDIAPNVYTLKYEELGYKDEPYVVSPYTNHNLPLVISGDGNVYVDYSSDLYAALQKAESKPKEGQDIRSLLVEDSPFVPAYSLPYTVDDQNEPVFMTP